MEFREAFSIPRALKAAWSTLKLAPVSLWLGAALMIVSAMSIPIGGNPESTRQARERTGVRPPIPSIIDDDVPGAVPAQYFRQQPPSIPGEDGPSDPALFAGALLCTCCAFLVLAVVLASIVQPGYLRLQERAMSGADVGAPRVLLVAIGAVLLLAALAAVILVILDKPAGAIVLGPSIAILGLIGIFVFHLRRVGIPIVDRFLAMAGWKLLLWTIRVLAFVAGSIPASILFQLGQSRLAIVAFFVTEVPVILFFWVALSLGDLAVVLEELGPFRALARSWRLTRGNRVRLLLFIMVTELIAIAGLLGSILLCVGAIVTLPLCRAVADLSLTEAFLQHTRGLQPQPVVAAPPPAQPPLSQPPRPYKGRAGGPPSQPPPGGGQYY